MAMRKNKQPMMSLLIDLEARHSLIDVVEREKLSPRANIAARWPPTHHERRNNSIEDSSLLGTGPIPEKTTPGQTTATTTAATQNDHSGSRFWNPSAIKFNDSKDG